MNMKAYFMEKFALRKNLNQSDYFKKRGNITITF